MTKFDFTKATKGFTTRFLAGLLVIVPIFFSYWIIKILLTKLDKIIGDFFTAYMHVSIPGLGLISLILIIWIVGAITTFYIGRQALGFFENILMKIPGVSTIYGGLKQISENLLSSKNNSFKQVVMVRSPFYGLQCIGFLSSSDVSILETSKTKSEVIHVFIPFTPPTSGFIIVVSPKDVTPLDISVEEGFKVVVSIGVIHPKKYIEKKIRSIKRARN